MIVCVNRRTNRRNEGLISADRAKVALSSLQYLFHYKSSARDLSLPMFEYTCDRRSPYCGLGNYWPKAILSLYIGRRVSWLSSLDSGLEAFSLNPARGSFAALTFQSTALPIMRTNGSSRTKLDCCLHDDFISRVKLTCLTTV